MVKQEKKGEEIVPGFPSRQEQEEDGSNSRLVIEEGQEVVQKTPKGKRGKYRQYEDAQFIIEKIRTYRTQRYPDSEIMSLLDNMPRRTYYNYVKKLQEQDLQIMEQWMTENVEHVSEELIIYRETLCQKLREVQGIIDNKNTPPKDRMQAIEQYLAISEKLIMFTRSGRSSDMKLVKYDSLSIF